MEIGGVVFGLLQGASLAEASQQALSPIQQMETALGTISWEPFASLSV